MNLLIKYIPGKQGLNAQSSMESQREVAMRQEKKRYHIYEIAGMPSTLRVGDCYIHSGHIKPS